MFYTISRWTASYSQFPWKHIFARLPTHIPFSWEFFSHFRLLAVTLAKQYINTLLPFETLLDRCNQNNNIVLSFSSYLTGEAFTSSLVFIFFFFRFRLCCFCLRFRFRLLVLLMLLVLISFHKLLSIVTKLFVASYVLLMGFPFHFNADISSERNLAVFHLDACWMS